MADKWIEERERQRREHDWRRSGADRPGEDPVFGERETGASYGGPNAGRGYRGRVGGQDYSRGGRFYGDDDRQQIYREEYGQGGVEYGDVPRGYDAEGSPRGGYAGPAYRPRPAYGQTASGGTGGYDYERGYGDGGRRDERGPLERAGARMAAWFRGDDAGRDRGHRGLGPKGYKRSDERISDDVHDRLTEDHWIDASEIAVAVSAGEVTLTGTVDSREAKHRAERIVEDLSGVTHVQNNLRVTASGGNFMSRDYGDSLMDAELRGDDPVANGTGGSGGGQSTAGKKDS
jgi:hypothetical protein